MWYIARTHWERFLFRAYPIHLVASGKKTIARYAWIDKSVAHENATRTTTLAQCTHNCAHTHIHRVAPIFTTNCTHWNPALMMAWSTSAYFWNLEALLIHICTYQAHPASVLRLKINRFEKTSIDKRNLDVATHYHMGNDGQACNFKRSITIQVRVNTLAHTHSMHGIHRIGLEGHFTICRFRSPSKAINNHYSNHPNTHTHTLPYWAGHSCGHMQR